MLKSIPKLFIDDDYATGGSDTCVGKDRDLLGFVSVTGEVNHDESNFYYIAR